MQFNIITIFPHIFDSYFNESIIKRAQEKKIIKIDIHNLRDYTNDLRKTVDDKPFGGGPGMILKVEPIYRAVKKLCEKNKVFSCHSGLDPESIILDSRFRSPRCSFGEAGGNDKNRKEGKKIRGRIILFSAKGKLFTQTDAKRLAKYDQLILICGRYEGVDERVAEHIADEEISIGEYVLTGGEIPAMIVVDAVSRLVPGVLGKKESLEEESFGVADIKRHIADRKKGISHKQSAISYLEYPQYTRPENFMGLKVPEVLLSGNHKEIEEWKKKMSQKRVK